MLIALLLAASGPQPVIEVRPATRAGVYCEVAVLGRVHPYPAAQGPILADFRRLRRQGQHVIVRVTDPNLPYRCVGAVLYLTQRAGLVGLGFLGNERVR